MSFVGRAALTLVLAGLVCSSPANARAAKESPSTPGISDEKIRTLCDVVSDQIPSTKGLAWLEENEKVNVNLPIGVGMHGHEVIFWEAAGVVAGDPPEIVRNKIQRFWLANRERLVCSQLGFKIRNGSLAKLAIERNSKHVMNDFVRRWNLDMNFIDKADGRTVLDYVEDELIAARGTSLEPILRRYRDLISRFGAKRGAELR